MLTVDGLNTARVCLTPVAVQWHLGTGCNVHTMANCAVDIHRHNYKAEWQLKFCNAFSHCATCTSLYEGLHVTTCFLGQHWVDALSNTIDHIGKLSVYQTGKNTSPLLYTIPLHHGHCCFVTKRTQNINSFPTALRQTSITVACDHRQWNSKQLLNLCFLSPVSSVHQQATTTSGQSNLT